MTSPRITYWSARRWVGLRIEKAGVRFGRWVAGWGQ